MVWFEGMTLDPHHLQQSDRYQESVLNARLRALAPYGWGLSGIAIDQEALANGEVVISRAVGVLSDGLPFDVPQVDASPEPRSIQDHFPPTEESVGVYLTLPLEHVNGSNVLLQGGVNHRETRFTAETVSIPDANTGADERSIEVAHPNLRIRFSGEPLSAYSAIQVAEVTRNAAGAFILKETYVPPCVSISGSERLITLARRLVELLVAKSTSLVERQRGILAQRELSPADLSALGILHAVNGHLPLLNHYFATRQGHPEHLFQLMLSLAGQLSSWVVHGSVQPGDFPAYDHARPSECFGRMEHILRELLGSAAPKANYVNIRLDRQRDNLYGARIDPELLRQAQLLLVARSDRLPEQVLISEMPRMLRIASPETIDAVLRSYTRALSLEHTTRLPSGMPVDGQANYFQLQQHGPFWDAVMESGALSIFVPSEFAGVNLQLLAINRP
ncbi:MAG TPA: type VI secretion system baseplate subunit TssK [Rhodothermales bacterium]|nr:type VI secretion system baseplate subunit TssK [Rhodothermales bacterium]